MANINPIGPDCEGKKYITRSGKVVTLVDSGDGLLESPETGYFYYPTALEGTGNLITYYESNPDDIVAEYKEPD